MSDATPLALQLDVVFTLPLIQYKLEKGYCVNIDLGEVRLFCPSTQDERRNPLANDKMVSTNCINLVLVNTHISMNHLGQELPPILEPELVLTTGIMLALVL